MLSFLKASLFTFWWINFYCCGWECVIFNYGLQHVLVTVHSFISEKKRIEWYSSIWCVCESVDLFCFVFVQILLLCVQTVAFLVGYPSASSMLQKLGTRCLKWLDGHFLLVTLWPFLLLPICWSFSLPSSKAWKGNTSLVSVIHFEVLLSWEEAGRVPCHSGAPQGGQVSI